MTTRPDLSDGIPGTVTEVSLTYDKAVTFEEWADSLTLLGRMGRAVGFWIGDSLVWGEERWGEKYAAAIDRLGMREQTLMNITWVCRSVQISRRKEELSFSHHEAIARLESPDQSAWLEKAIQGETLPAGGRRPWSVSRLRAEMKALGPGRAPKAPPPLLGGAVVLPDQIPPGQIVLVHTDPDWKNAIRKLVELLTAFREVPKDLKAHPAVRAAMKEAP